MRVRLFVSILAATALLAATRAADQKPTPDASAKAFGLDKVWSMHLTIPAKDWQKMQPTKGFGNFGWPAKPAEPDKDRKTRGSFGLDFVYVKGTLEIDGKTYKDVGVRFKGGGTYVTSQGRLKRPFKIDLARSVPGQNFHGLRKLTLNNNVMDPTCAREVLSYGVYRSLAVPCPRTAYAQLTITVPGKYDKQLAGLYTLVEPIDKTFLKGRFGSAKGLLVKPEGVGPLEHLGEAWAPYEQRYRPKTAAGKKAQRRLIEFTKLVQKADDKTFAREVGSYLDVDGCLRFLAGTVALANMDSFVGFGHNYLLYLNPKTNKFVFLPWDLDLSFGAFAMMASADGLTDLSIRKPWNSRNRLVQRLLADPKAYAAYKGHLKALFAKALTPEEIKKDLARINKVIKPALEKEKKAMADRRERAGWGFGGGFMAAPAIETFVARRGASVAAQLAGKRKGTVVARGFGFGPLQFLVRPILDAADQDDDDMLSKSEVTAAAKALFKALDKEGKGELDQKAIAPGLAKLLPRPGGMGGFPGPGGNQAAPLAKVIVEKAGKNGKVTEAGLVAAAARLFAEADKDKDGKLDDGELGGALNRLMPPPPFRPLQFLVKPILDAADKDKDRKLTKAEVTAGVKALFKALDKDGKGEVDQKAVAAGLNKLLPGPFGGPGAWLARPFVEKAGKGGKVTEASLVAAAVKFFTEADKDKDGKVDENELGEGLNKLLAPPQFGPPPQKPRDPKPAEKKEGGK
jgi:hypothetical protein